MSVRKLSVALAAVVLTVAPVAAQAAPVARAAAPTAEANELRKDLLVFAVILAALVAWAVIETNNNDNDPISA